MDVNTIIFNLSELDKIQVSVSLIYHSSIFKIIIWPILKSFKIITTVSKSHEKKKKKNPHGQNEYKNKIKAVIIVK